MGTASSHCHRINRIPRTPGLSLGRRGSAALAIAALAIIAGCGSKQAPEPFDPADQEASEESAPALQSSDILEREPLANKVEVRHILIGWSDLKSAYRGTMDPRAESRSREDADAFTKALYDRIKAGESFEDLMEEHSEDRGSAQSRVPIEVTPDAQLVLDFRRLSLRLQVGEVGIVLSSYGWHIIKRIS